MSGTIEIQLRRYQGTTEQPYPPCKPGFAECVPEDEVAKDACEALGAMPPWHYADVMLESGLHRIFCWDSAQGPTLSALRYIGEKQAAEALGDPPDGAGAPAVGQSLGDATIISATNADNWCTSTAGATNDGFVGGIDPPADVLNLITPNQVIPGPGPYYAQYKTGPQAQVWRFTAQEGYAQCQGVVVNGVPGDPPGTPGQGNAPPPPGGGQAPGTTGGGLTTGQKVAIGVGLGVLVIGGVALAVVYS